LGFIARGFCGITQIRTKVDSFLDLDEMIHNLEVERQRIDEALHVLRRLNRTRNSSRLAASNEGKREGMPEVEGDENDLPLTSGDDSKSS
jgi:hypothetical protein